MQAPATHVSSIVQNSPSSHTVPSGSEASAGQLPDVPVHCSAMSHWPDSLRHTTVLGTKPSTGQSPLEPVQNSCSSQTPSASRQQKSDDLNVSAGQLAEFPV
ncbi:MAG: hypothetical protein LC667_04435, partial [Thioalkalivibrio sp.]|nr:hypothetical protein [Thioalkalivibrio sp.]